MKVKDIAVKMADFGTNPYIFIQRGALIIGAGKPDEIAAQYGKMRVNTFVAITRGQIKIYVD